jgi:hypothetical protein
LVTTGADTHSIVGEALLMSSSRSAHHERTFALLKLLEAYGRRVGNYRVVSEAGDHLRTARERWAVDIFRLAA